MPVRQARCFVLRTYRVAEADLVVVLFSADEGKLRGWARGARKPKSRFGSCLGAGNEVDVGWFEREGRELVQVDRCDLVASALPLVRDPVLGGALRYLSELVDLFALEREPNPRLYRLLAACRDALVLKRPVHLVTAYFEAWALRLAGLYPRPGRCECGKGFETGGGSFFASGPVFACPDCAPGRGEPTGRLSGPAFAALADFWRQGPAAIEAPGAVGAELFHFHGRLTVAAAERGLPARTTLETLLRSGAGDAPAPA